MLSTRASQIQTHLRFGVMAVACLLLSAGSAVAQPTPDCLQELEPLLHDTSNNCIGHPTNPKFFETTTFYWSGTQQLAVNDGNELQVWDLTDPQNPMAGDHSNFNVPNLGDSDYDLLNFTICDDCRWGAASYKAGQVLFDLWGANGVPGSEPDFARSRLYETGFQPSGSFTFKYGNQQYLMARGLPGDCAGNTTLYKINGIDEGDLEVVQCVTGPFFGQAQNGFHIQPSVGSDYLYVGFQDGVVYIFEVQEFGNTINLQYTGNNQMRAILGRPKGMRVDHAAQLAITARSTDGAKIWDISNPANPVQRAHLTGTLSLGGIRYPFAWVARINAPDTHVTLNIEDPSNPVVLDQNFWHPDHPWNSHNDECEYPTSGDFSADGSTLYIARYSVVQAIDFTACAGPVQPTANLNISPDPAFPGDQVTVTDTSIGTVDTTYIWITPSNNPADTLLAGSVTVGTDAALPYTIPVDVLAADEFWAHVAVANGDFPCEPLVSCPPQQMLTREILLDRTPEAFITIDPVNPITGDTIDLFGSGEGSPGGSPAPFHWRVEDPDGNFDTNDGQTWTDFPLDQSGDWQIRLRVDYRHEVEGGGGLYQAVRSSTPLRT